MNAAAGTDDEPLSAHARCVQEWLARSGDSRSHAALPVFAPPTNMPALFLAGLRAIWDRALPSLGAVMLTTIFERVITLAEGRHAGLRRVGLHVHERSSIEMLTPSALTADLSAAVSFTLAELLEVLDQLTAQSLTPGLYSALSAACPQDGGVR